MKTIELYFDYASPWAYLAEMLVPRLFGGLTVVRRPTYLRAFDAFAKGVPYSVPKLQYLMRDFLRCAAHEGIPFRPPTQFPINGVHALRGALIAEREGCLDAYHRAMFRAAWQDDRDVSNADVVADVARESCGAKVQDALSDPWAKGELRARGEAAIARGLFGVPTFVVGDELFWGHDRMAYAMRAATAE